MKSFSHGKTRGFPCFPDKEWSEPFLYQIDRYTFSEYILHIISYESNTFPSCALTYASLLLKCRIYHSTDCSRAMESQCTISSTFKGTILMYHYFAGSLLSLFSQLHVITPFWTWYYRTGPSTWIKEEMSSSL